MVLRIVRRESRGRTPEIPFVAKPKVIVVMPAYNAEKTVEATVRDIPESVVDEIILVDDYR